MIKFLIKSNSPLQWLGPLEYSHFLLLLFSINACYAFHTAESGPCICILWPLNYLWGFYSASLKSRWLIHKNNLFLYCLLLVLYCLIDMISCRDFFFFNNIHKIITFIKLDNQKYKICINEDMFYAAN